MTKGKDILNFVKSQPPFDVHWQYLDFSDRFTGRSFEVSPSNFSLFCLFLKIWLHFHRFLSFISYPLVFVLHLEPFESNLFELGFSIFQKTLQERKFLHDMKYFSRFLLLSRY